MRRKITLQSVFLLSKHVLKVGLIGFGLINIVFGLKLIYKSSYSSSLGLESAQSTKMHYLKRK